MNDRLKKYRKRVGTDHVSAARSVEGTVEFVRDTKLTSIKVHTKRERKAIDEAEELIVEAAKKLRGVGNRMENPKERR